MKGWMKRALIALSALFLCAALSGCSRPLPRAEDVLRAVQAGQGFESLTPMDAALLSEYLGLDAAALTDSAAAFDATRVTPEAVIVLTARDEKAADGIEKLLQTYLDDLREEYRGYKPEEMPKLEAAKVLRAGRLCALLIAKDIARAEKDFRALWK